MTKMITQFELLSENMMGNGLKKLNNVGYMEKTLNKNLIMGKWTFIQMKKEVSVQTIQRRVEIRVEIEMMDRVTMIKNVVAVMLLGRKVNVTRKHVSHPMNVKLLRRKRLNWRTFIQRACLNAFSTKRKRQTKCWKGSRMKSQLSTKGWHLNPFF